MASRKEEKERLRREREERERAASDAQRRKRLIGYGTGGVLALAALIVLIVAVVLPAIGGDDNGGEESSLLPAGGRVGQLQETDVAKAAETAGCEFKNEKAKSRDHTGDPSEIINYDSNPPMSGRHFETPAQESAYTEAPPDPSLVHALEHGRVNVWYKPTAPKQVRADLKALYDRDQGFQELLIPRPDMPYTVAASAWTADPQPLGTGHLLGCRTANAQSLEALQAFIEKYRGNGPEPVP